MMNKQTIAQAYTYQGAKRHKSHKLLWTVLLLIVILLFLGVTNFHPPATTKHGWNLILVNDDYCIPDDYEVNLVTLSNGQQVDCRIYPDLQNMFDDMRNQGVYPIVASGYRTEAKQQQFLDDKISEYQSLGHSWWKSRKLALQWVSKPGTSEHQLGIAVDINQDGSRSTATQVYNWLEENAHRYGFIYRYPEDKTEITGVGNEPWHYRYVGKEVAQEIYEQGLCLEEYLERLDDC